jgi:hypothetical protein
MRGLSCPIEAAVRRVARPSVSQPRSGILLRELGLAGDCWTPLLRR